jgi:poly(A) polymerase
MTGRGGTGRLDAPWLARGPVPRLLAILDADGEEARVIGGAVRNALLGETPREFDIATTARPEVVTARAAAAGLKSVPTGFAHGTVTVIVEGVPFEVTTLRQDIETFGRKARVQFGRDWKADAERRDFTINALSVTRNGRLHDYVGGLADVAARRVRFIGDAGERIREDYLRTLRFFRFHAAYGHGAPDPDGLHAAILERAGLERLSRERVGMEWMKLLVAPGAVATLAVMADAGFVAALLAGVPRVPHLERLAAIEAALGLNPDAVRRLGVLMLHVGEDAERLRRRLRLANHEFTRLQSMAEHWWRVVPHMEQGGRVLLYHIGPQPFVDRVLLAWARAGAAPEDAAWRELVELPRRWSVPRLPDRASDLIARGLAPGPALGKALRAAEAAWTDAGFPHDVDAVRAIADLAAARATARP